MSSVDNRVVQMEFDNKRFESNVKETMGTLDKLKQALNFDEEADGLRLLKDESEKVKFDGMASALDKIANKFTLLGNIGFQAMERIAKAAVDAGEKIVKSITVDQVGAGMSKYEQETNSVQAIYAAVKRKGKSLDDVYDSLDRLAEYSDETSYSYTQMVDGASKFIANGIDMDDAVTAMMGISNAAAQSGVSIQDASYAFKNFSDAMSAGHFMIKDWQSIQNIHMDTEQFKQEVIDTAKALGKLDAQGRVIDKTTGKVKKNAEALTVQNFREQLKYGFFDTDVMMEVLKKYADFDWDRVRDGNFLTMGDEAAAMAQNAKTFTDVLDSLKDASSTGWKESFRYIFGNLEEAIDFFTPMANNAIELIQEVASARNALLKGWKESGGRDSMIAGLKTIWETFIMLKDQFKHAASFIWGDNSPFGRLLDGGILANITKGFQSAAEGLKNWLNGVDEAGGGNRMMKLTGIFQGLVSILEYLRMVFSAIGTFFGNIFHQLEPTFDALLSLFNSVGRSIKRLVTRIKASGALEKIANGLAKAWSPLLTLLPHVIGWLQQLFQFIMSIFENNVDLSVWGEKITNVFGKVSDAIEGFFKADVSGEEGFWNKLKKRLTSFSEIGNWVSQKWETFKKNHPFVDKVTTWFSTAWTKLTNWFKTSDFGKKLTEIWGKLSTVFTGIFGKIKAGDWQGAWEDVKGFFSGIFDDIAGIITSGYETIKAAIAKVAPGISDFFGNLFTGLFPGASAEEFDESAIPTDGIVGTVLAFGDAAETVAEAGEKGETFGEKFSKGMQLFKTMFGAVFNDVATFLEAHPTFITSLTEFIKSLLTMWLMFKRIKALSSITDAFTSAGGAFGNIGESISGVFNSISGIFGSAGGVFTTTSNGISEVFTNVNTQITNFHKRDFAAKLKDFAISLLAVAGSIWIMVNAVRVLSRTSYKSFKTGLLRASMILVAIAGFISITNLLSNLGNKTGRYAVSITSLIGIIVVLWSASKIISRLAEIKAKTFTDGYQRLVWVLGALALFLVAVNVFGRTERGTKSGLKIGGILAMVAAVWLLGKIVMQYAEHDFAKFITGLVYMLSIMALLAGFIIAANRFGATSVESKPGLTIGKLLGVVAAVWLLGKLVMKFGESAVNNPDQWDKGLGGLALIMLMLAAFMVLVNKFGSTGPGMKQGTSFLSMIGVIAAIYVLYLVMKQVGSMEDEKLMKGLVGLAAIMGSLAILMIAVLALAKLDLGKAAQGIVGLVIVMAALVGLIYVLTLVLDKVEAISSLRFLAFAGAMLLLSIAMVPLSAVVATLGTLGVGAAIKGAIGLVLMFGALALGIALVSSVTSGALGGFSSAISELGAAIDTFRDVTGDIDSAAIQAKLDLAKSMADAAAYIGIKSYGNLDQFNTSIARLGSAMLLFNMTTSGIDLSSKTQLTTDLVKMASDLSGLSKVEDVSETIANIGAAISLYDKNTAGVDLSQIPDTTKITQIFEAIHGAALESMGGDMMADISGFASEDTKETLTQFALGLINISSAMSEFSAAAGEMNFGNVEQAAGVLDSIASLSGKLGTKTKTTITQFAGFSRTVTETVQSGDLTGFSTNIPLLGAALKDFNREVGGTDVSKMNQAVQVLDKINEINTKLPKEGGMWQWVIGTASLTKFGNQIKLLGQNLSEFYTSVSGEGFNAENVGGALQTIWDIVDINNNLPELGGLKQWWHGAKDLGTFADDVGELGQGIHEFVTQIGATEIGQNAKDAIEQLQPLIDLEIKLTGATIRGETMAGFAQYFETIAGHFKGMNDILNTITEPADMTAFMDTIDWVTDIDQKLNGRSSTKQLHDFVVDYQEMLKDIKWIGDNADTYDINEEKVNNIAGHLSAVIGAMNESLGGIFMGSLTTGFESQNGVVEASAGEVANTSVMKIRTYWKGFRTAGEYLMQGLASGIKSEKQTVIDAIMALANELPNTLRAEWKIESPSKVFAEIGDYAMQGLEEGIATRASDVEDRVRSVGDDTAIALKNLAKDTRDEMSSLYPMPTDGSMTAEEYEEELKALIDDELKNKLDSSGLLSGSGGSSGSSDDSSGSGGSGSGSGSGSSGSSGSSGTDYSSDLTRIISEQQTLNDRIETIMSDLSAYFSWQYAGGIASDSAILTVLNDLLSGTGNGAYSDADVTPVIDGSNVDTTLSDMTLNTSGVAATGCGRTILHREPEHYHHRTSDNEQQSKRIV